MLNELADVINYLKDVNILDYIDDMLSSAAVFVLNSEELSELDENELTKKMIEYSEYNIFRSCHVLNLNRKNVGKHTEALKKYTPFLLTVINGEINGISMLEVP